MRIKDWLIPIILCGIIGIAFFIQCNTIDSLKRDLIKTRAIAGNLPEDMVTTSIMERHVLKEISRIDGTDSLIIETNYVPVESEIVTTVVLNEEALTQLEQVQILLWQLQQNTQSSADSARIDSLRSVVHNIERDLYHIEVEYDTHGTCLAPEVGIGLDTDAKLNVEAGARLYYINRFGIGLHGALEIPADSEDDWNGSVGIFGDCRIKGLNNSAFFGSLDYDFPSEKLKGMAGVHVYFGD